LASIGSQELSIIKGRKESKIAWILWCYYIKKLNRGGLKCLEKFFFLDLNKVFQVLEKVISLEIEALEVRERKRKRNEEKLDFSSISLWFIVIRR
jgi:hypothetical protein